MRGATIKIIDAQQARLRNNYKNIGLKLLNNFSKVQHRLPDDGPNGPKHVGAIMRYFNCIF